MKKTFLILLPVFFVFVAVKACDNRSEKAKIAHPIMFKVIDLLETRYHLRYAGREESSDKGAYKTIGLLFNKFGKMSKDEGRKTIIDCVNVLLNEINSDSQLQPFLIEKPFTLSNVEIMIIVFTDEGKDIFYPDIQVFAFFCGKVHYSTNSPGHKYGHYTEEKETFEEAVRIIEAQNVEPLFPDQLINGNSAVNESTPRPDGVILEGDITTPKWVDGPLPIL